MGKSKRTIAMRLHFGCIQKMCKRNNGHAIIAYHVLSISCSCQCIVSIHSDHACNGITPRTTAEFRLFFFSLFFESFSVCLGLRGQNEIAREKIVHVRDRVDVVPNCIPSCWVGVRDPRIERHAQSGKIHRDRFSNNRRNALRLENAMNIRMVN